MNIDGNPLQSKQKKQKDISPILSDEDGKQISDIPKIIADKTSDKGQKELSVVSLI